MAKRFDLLVFDWDGTLFDSTGSIVRSLQAACLDLGQPEPTAVQARHVIGLELSLALRQVAPQLPAERLPELVDRYRHHYLGVDKEIELFGGVRELIADLHADGYLLTVATGKSRKGLDRALLNSGLGPYFSTSRCADECFSKPHPQMLDEIMDEVGVPPERALMIGDTTHDMQMAANGAVAGLAVTYGAHAAADLRILKPLACVDSVEEMTVWLKRNA